MAYTNQQLVNEARTYLNDSLEQRFTDESLLAFLRNFRSDRTLPRG